MYFEVEKPIDCTAINSPPTLQLLSRWIKWERKIKNKNLVIFSKEAAPKWLWISALILAGQPWASYFISLCLVSSSVSRSNTSCLPELLRNEIAHAKPCQTRGMPHQALWTKAFVSPGRGETPGGQLSLPGRSLDPAALNIVSAQ